MLKSADKKVEEVMEAMQRVRSPAAKKAVAAAATYTDAPKIEETPQSTQCCGLRAPISHPG